MTCRHWKPIAFMILLSGTFSAQVAAQERKVSVLPSELPAVIRKAIEQAFPKGKIIKIEKEAEGENPGQYDVEISSDSKEYEVEISPEGKIVEAKEKTTEQTEPGQMQSKKWTEFFDLKNRTFSSVGGNRFFILEPGHQLILESRTEKVVITVLNETKKIGDVETRIVEEREEENGELKEVSRNFFAICKRHGDVFYFGEEVDDYKDGKIVAHSGAWRADEENSRAGIIMPGTILLGARHYQEMAPNAMDRAEIISDDVTMKTPAGIFKNCVRVEETSGIDPDDKCYKTYAPGVGLIQDEDLVLTGCSEAKKRSISLEGLPLDEDEDYKKAILYAFTDAQTDKLADGFESGMTGKWKSTEWKVWQFEGNKVLAHIGFWDEDPDAVFPVCWVKDSKAKDLTLSVKLYPLSPPKDVKGAIHDGSGIIIRFKNPDNYYLLRAVPYEKRVRFYKVQNGKRTTLGGKDLKIELGQWHDLKLKASGNTFTAYFNGEKLFHILDTSFPEAGAFGLWCKPNNVTYFDDLKAEIRQ